MYILTINGGSSSIKSGLYKVIKGECRLRYRFHVDGLLSNEPRLIIDDKEATEDSKEIMIIEKGGDVFQNSIQAIISTLERLALINKIEMVSHRVVHGGDQFVKPTAVTDEVLVELEALIPLAPLHQPYNLKFIELLRERINAEHVACFDTMFHASSHGEINAQYALPKELRDKGIKRYGFHGLSYQYVSEVFVAKRDGLQEKNIYAHLGSGCSLAACVGRIAKTSSMGFSALGGVPMSTRTGDLDPGVLLYLMAEGYSHSELEKILYKDSGWKGLSEFSGDMREILNATYDPMHEHRERASKAVEHFTLQVAKQIASMAVDLKGLDNIVFTGGMGENSADLRKRICQHLKYFGVHVNDAKNRVVTNGRFESEDSSVNLWVIPTDEELCLANSAKSLRS